MYFWDMSLQSLRCNYEESGSLEILRSLLETWDWWRIDDYLQFKCEQTKVASMVEQDTSYSKLRFLPVFIATSDTVGKSCRHILPLNWAQY